MHRNKQQCGLPNIGNTCFINSIVNCLFASKSFKKIIERNKNKKQATFVSLLANIFVSIQSYKSIQDMSKCVRDLVVYMQTIFAQYKLGSEQDSLIYLIKMIEQLFLETNQKSLFMIKYEKICLNQNKSNHLSQQLKQYQELVLSNTFQKCSKCKYRNMEFIYLNNIPQNILMHNQKIQNNYISIKSYKNQLNAKNQHMHLLYCNYDKLGQPKQFHLLHYQLKSKSLYIGDGVTGHYIAVRKKIQGVYNQNQKQSQKFYKFDDHKIRGIQSDQKSNLFTTKFVLYELIQNTDITIITQQQQVKITNGIDEIKTIFRMKQTIIEWHRNKDINQIKKNTNQIYKSHKIKSFFEYICRICFDKNQLENDF